MALKVVGFLADNGKVYKKPSIGKGINTRLKNVEQKKAKEAKEAKEAKLKDSKLKVSLINWQLNNRGGANISIQ